VGLPQVQVEQIDDAVVVGIAYLPGRAAAAGVRLPDVQIGSIHDAVEIEIAGIRGHDVTVLDPLSSQPSVNPALAAVELRNLPTSQSPPW